MIHPRRSRAFLQTRSQPRQLLACPHGEHFDVAIGIIADPSSNLQYARLALDKPAKAHALHTTTDEKATSLGGMLIWDGCHSSIAEARGQIAEVRSFFRRRYGNYRGLHLCNLTS